jgi:hypothetical protein
MKVHILLSLCEQATAAILFVADFLNASIRKEQSAGELDPVRIASPRPVSTAAMAGCI